MTHLDFAALVARTEGLQPWRRVFHAASGCVLALAPAALGWERGRTVAVLAVALVLLVALDVARLAAPRLNAAFFRLFPALASPREARGPASSTWYVLGVLLVWLTFPPVVAVPAVLVLALADPAASVVGRLAGRRRFGKGSVEGGAAFSAVACAVLLVTGWGWGAPIVAALAAGVEVLPLDDNLAVPLSTAAFLQGWLLLHPT